VKGFRFENGIETVFNYWSSQIHRGYTIVHRTSNDGTKTWKDYVAMQGSEIWFEGETPEAVKAVIDSAMEET
jgi:hypothetical protein